MSPSLLFVSSKPGVSIKTTFLPSNLMRATEMSWVPAEWCQLPASSNADFVRMIQEVRPWPIAKSVRPVAFEMKVVFPAPVTPRTAIKMSSCEEELIFLVLSILTIC